MALANALIQVLTDRQLALNLRKKGLSHVKKFDWDILVKKYIAFYQEMMKR